MTIKRTKKLVVEFTFSEEEWADYTEVNPELVYEDLELDLKNGVSAKVISSEGFLERNTQ